MTKICDKTLFHITRHHQHSRFYPLSVGSNFDVGTQYNPFFHYYENPTFERVNTPDGSIEHVGSVDFFLKRVRDRDITGVSYEVLAAKAASTSENYQILSQELLMENARLNHAPEAPSRLRCLWTTETMQQCRDWQKLLPNGRIVELKATGQTIEADSNLLPRQGDPLSTFLDKATRYWTGEHSANPILEILFVGTATVVREIS